MPSTFCHVQPFLLLKNQTRNNLWIITHQNWTFQKLKNYLTYAYYISIIFYFFIRNMEACKLKGFKIPKSPEFLANLAMASGAFWKYNKEIGALPSYVTVTLQPYRVKKQHFQIIRKAQTIWIKLLVKLSENLSLIQNLHKSLENDEMIGNMLKIARKLVSQKREKVTNFFILRADYIFNAVKKTFQQTEYNAIAVGLWTLSDATQDFHRALQPLLENPFEIDYQPVKYRLIQAFKQVYEIYSKQYNVKPAILIVAQGNDTDTIQQADIEKMLLLNGIGVIKASFKALSQGRLVCSEDGIIKVDGIQVGIVYYRQGYNPSHYSAEGSWLVRQKLQMSRAICVPNIFIHLLNFKNVQTMLKTTNIIRQHLSEQEAKHLLDIQTTLFTHDQIKNQKQDLIKQYGNNLVVKSIHQGSQQNYFYEKAVDKLRQLEPQQIIVMEYIQPQNRPIQLLGQNNKIIQYNAISEVGLYGFCIYKSSEQIERNQYVGYLIRTYEDNKGEVQISHGTKGIDSISFI